MNSSYEKYEEEVSIFSVLWYCASRWKSILIVAIIGLVLGCGLAFVKSQSNSTSDQTEIQEQKEASMEETALEQLYEYSLDRMNGLQEYIKESKIMELDPFNVYCGTVTYNIKAAHNEISALDGAIKAFVYNGEMYSELEEKTGLYNANDLVQLVGYTQQNSTNGVIVENGSIGQTVHTISIVGATEEEAQTLLTQLEKSLESFLSEVSTEYYITDYSVQNASVMNTKSLVLAEYQDTIRNNISREKDNLKDQQKALEDLDKSLGDAPSSDDGISKKTLLMYGVIGAIVGGVIAVCIWILVFAWGGGLYSVDSIERKYKIKLLGSIHNLEKMNVIDRWIAQKRGGVYSLLPVEEQRKIVLLNLKNELKKLDNVKKIFLVSSLGSGLEEAVILKAGLEAAGYQVQGFENVIGRADVLEQVTQSDAVIALENVETSKADAVEAEITALKEYANHVLGIVIIANRK